MHIRIVLTYQLIQQVVDYKTNLLCVYKKKCNYTFLNGYNYVNKINK